jgi:hypothetical protein
MSIQAEDTVFSNSCGKTDRALLPCLNVFGVKVIIQV